MIRTTAQMLMALLRATIPLVLLDWQYRSKEHVFMGIHKKGTASHLLLFSAIALIIFMLFFVLIVIQLLRLDKNYLKKMAQLPLDPENNSQNFKGE